MILAVHKYSGLLEHDMKLEYQVDECKVDHEVQNSGKILICEKVEGVQSRQGSVFDITCGVVTPTSSFYCEKVQVLNHSNDLND